MPDDINIIIRHGSPASGIMYGIMYGAYVCVCASLAYARVLRIREEIFLDKILILRIYPNFY